MRPRRVKRERLDLVHPRLRAALKIHQSDLLVQRLFLFLQLLVLGFRHADGVRRPARVRREGGLRAERRDRRGAAADARDAKLAVAVRFVDDEGDVAAVRRQTAAVLLKLQRLPLAVIRRRGRRLRLRAQKNGEGNSGGRRGENDDGGLLHGRHHPRVAARLQAARSWPTMDLP